MALKIENFYGELIDTNAYLVFDEESKQILIIDAPLDVDEQLKDRVCSPIQLDLVNSPTPVFHS